MNETISILVMVGGGLGTFLLGMKHLSEGLQALLDVHDRISAFAAKVSQCLKAPRRAYYLNIAETLNGSKNLKG